MHVTSLLVSSIAVYYSMSSDKFNATFLRFIRKKVFYIKYLIYVYITFSEHPDSIFLKKAIV